jgi:hypothetical protein
MAEAITILLIESQLQAVGFHPPGLAKESLCSPMSTQMRKLGAQVVPVGHPEVLLSMPLMGTGPVHTISEGHS